jgi:hypothetical protein
MPSESFEAAMDEMLVESGSGRVGPAPRSSPLERIRNRTQRLLGRLRRAREAVQREFDEMEMDLFAVMNAADRPSWDAELPSGSMLDESQYRFEATADTLPAGDVVSMPPPSPRPTSELGAWPAANCGDSAPYTGDSPACTGSSFEQRSSPGLPFSPIAGVDESDAAGTAETVPGARGSPARWPGR